MIGWRYCVGVGCVGSGCYVFVFGVDDGFGDDYWYGVYGIGFGWRCRIECVVWVCGDWWFVVCDCFDFFFCFGGVC